MSFEQIGQTGPKRSHAFYAAILILGALIVGTGTLPSTLMLSINPKIFKLQVAHPKHSEFVKQTAMQQNISQNIYSKTTNNGIITNKTFAFLIVSCKHKPEYNFINDDVKDVLWYTFCEEYTDYDKTELTMFYKSEKTTWAQGRNFLLDQAIENMPSSRSYEYFIFLDDDMLDQMRFFTYKIKEFQDWLLIERPAIGYMRGSSTWMWEHAKIGHTNIDPNVAAHHKSTLGLILPMNDEGWLTKASWNYAIWINNILASIIYPTERIGFMDVFWDYSKAQHTNNSDYDRSTNWALPTMYLNDAVLKSGEIRPGLNYLYGGIPNKVEKARHGLCSNFCGRHVPKKCKKTRHFCDNRKVLLNGPPTVDWLLANFDEKHNFTRELLDFHTKHRDYLDSIRESEFKPKLLI